MSLLPDPATLDAIADRIAQHAVRARAEAATLGAVVAALDWRGVAANAFRGQAGGVVTDLRIAAGRLDHASDALYRHASSARGVLSEVAGIGLGGLRAVEDVVSHPGVLLGGGRRLIGDAGRALSGLGRVVGLG